MSLWKTKDRWSTSSFSLHDKENWYSFSCKNNLFNFFSCLWKLHYILYFCHNWNFKAWPRDFSSFLNHDEIKFSRIRKSATMRCVYDISGRWATFICTYIHVFIYIYTLVCLFVSSSITTLRFFVFFLNNLFV